VKRIVLITLAAFAALGGLAYLGDDLSLRFGIPARAEFGSFDVRHFYAVKLKNKSTNYMYDDPQPEECVNALFPHFGDNPCWYTKRHTTVEIKIDAGASGALFDTP
jgi:hypothetical protein